MPEALVLGDISYSDMDYFRIGPLSYMSGPNIQLIQPEFTLARKKLNKFFQSDIELSPNIHLETDKMYGIIDDMVAEDFHDLTVYVSEHNLKRKIGLP